MSKESKSIYKYTNLQIIFAITLIGVMAVSLLSPALPSIRNHFGVSETEVGLLVTMFTLPGIFLSLLIGALTDRFGRLQVLVPSLFLFGIAGGACALSPNFLTLLVLRFLQGIGGAGLVNIATTLIGDFFEGTERAGAMGANASILSVGTASYPFLGGILAEVSWAAPFLLFLSAVPIGLIAIVFLENPEVRSSSSGVYLSHVKEIVSKPVSVGGMVASCLAFVMLYGGVITFFSQLVSYQFQASPFQVGLLIGSMSIMVALVSSQTGNLVKRSSKPSLIVLGFIAYAAGLLIIPFIQVAWMFLLPMSLFGLGHGLAIPNLQTLFSEIAPRPYRGATMSLFNISSRTGQTLGPPVLGLFFTLGGFFSVFISAGVISLVVGLAGVFLVFSRS